MKDESWQELYARVMAPETFGITLTCPDCNSPLNKYRCLQCVNQNKGDNKFGAVAILGIQALLTVVSYSIPVFLGVVGFMLFGRQGVIIGSVIGIALATINMRDLINERTKNAATKSAELRMAQRYHNSSSMYDQAALCYLNWLKTYDRFDCPPGLVPFLTNYKNSSGANGNLRDSLLDVVFVKACAVWGDSQYPELLEVASNNSYVQNMAVKALKEFEENARSRGQKTTSLKLLLAHIQRSTEALIRAAGCGDAAAAKTLVDNGANVNAKTNDGTTALIQASSNGHYSVVQLLLNKGADVNDKKNDGNTALIFASQWNHYAVVQALLDKGSEVNAKRNDGKTALDAAKEGGHTEVEALLVKAGAK
jgi:Ankyrin repeats (many copies)